MKRHLIPLALGLTACAALTRASPPSLIWNTTASAPIGLYRVLSPRPMRRGDLVAIAPPPALANALARRGVLPLGVPLIKPVAGLPGDLVCRHRRTITVAGRTLASARLRDSHGRPLPAWSGCRLIGDDELFLLNAARDDSFDGRYFGPISAQGLLGPVAPLWTRSSPSAAPETAR